jgi:hypothetical protein
MVRDDIPHIPVRYEQCSGNKHTDGNYGTAILISHLLPRIACLKPLLPILVILLQTTTSLPAVHTLPNKVEPQIIELLVLGEAL